MTKRKLEPCTYPIDTWIWQDCDIKGHEEGCFMLLCLDCGTVDRDCEDEL